MISNENLWDVTNQQPIGNQIKEMKWRWIGHTLRKTDSAIERAALNWNPHGAWRRGRPRKTWKVTVEEEAAVMGKIWKEVKRLANNRTRWRCFTDALCSVRSDRKLVVVVVVVVVFHLLWWSERSLI
jgi:hypothetical protein